MMTRTQDELGSGHGQARLGKRSAKSACPAGAASSDVVSFRPCRYTAAAGTAVRPTAARPSSDLRAGGKTRAISVVDKEPFRLGAGGSTRNRGGGLCGERRGHAT